MRIARVNGVRGPEFAASLDGDAWALLSELGLECLDLQAVIHAIPQIQDRMPDANMIGLDEAQFGCPVVRPSKVIGIGLNYLDHIRETGSSAPERPVVFAKFSNALTGPFDTVIVDKDATEQADYEVELAVVIGQTAKKVSISDALAHVFGYAVANDVSARDWQRKDGEFCRSKSFDTFCPIGPWITTADEIPDPQALRIRSIVNGEVRQDSSTGSMLFSIADLITFLCRTMTLIPGDVILTGTPHGVGFAIKPPVFLRPGDIVRCEIEHLGWIENRIANSANS